MVALMTSYDQVGVKEDVSNIISNIAPTKTPFQSMVGTDKIKQRLAQWQEDSLDAAANNAQVEGADAPTADMTPTVMRNNTTQIFMKTVRVTGTGDETDTYGRDKELSYQLAKKSKELKRDLERAYVGVSNALVAGDSSTAREMASYDQMIAAGTTEAAPDGDTVTGGTQASALSEQSFLNCNQKLYNEGGEATIFMVKPNDSIRVANFATATGRQRDIGNDRRIVNAVDVLVTPFGTQRVVISRWVLSTTALLFDPMNWKQLVLRPWFRETLAKTGDATKVMLCGEFSLKHVNYKASGIITNLAA